MLQNFRDRAAGGGDRFRGAVTGARERVNQHLSSAQERLTNGTGDYSELRKSLREYVEERAAVHGEALRDAGFGIKNKTGEMWERSKKDAERKLFELSEPMRAKVLLALRESVKSGLVADPDMCACVKTRLEDLVDLFWDDLTISVEKAMDDAKQATLGEAETDVDNLGKVGQVPCLLGPRWWRAKILYHMLPYDLSIFGNFKDPIFWILMVFMCMPCFSFLPEPLNLIPVRVPFFILYLILVVTGCPADEFQLVQFIMAIKGLQFVCSGVLMMCYAAFTYYMCVHPGGEHTCDKTGPGAKQGLVVSVVDWLGTCILVWIAFLWLPCSERSAGLRDIGEGTPAGRTNGTNQGSATNQGGRGNDPEAAPEAEEEDTRATTCCGSKGRDSEKGGRLKGWLVYDIICFILSVILCWFLMCVDYGHLRPGGKPSKGFPGTDGLVEQASAWTGHAAIYWARIIYALLSVPFLLFWIPGLQGILTHTRLTGYNRNGVCVPYMLHPMPEKPNAKNG